MKKRIAILVGVAMVLAVGVLVIWRVAARRCVSMTFLEYQRWPRGAMVRLANDSRLTVRYLAEPNGLPMGSPLLHARKTSDGWFTVPSALESTSYFDPRTGKTTDAFFFAPPSGLKPGDRLTSLFMTDEGLCN